MYFKFCIENSECVIEFLNKNRKKFEEMFETKIDLLKNPSNVTYTEFFIPTPNLEIEPNNTYSGLTEAIILYESIHSIYKILKRLKRFSQKLDYEFQQDFIKSTIDSYKQLLKQLRLLLYRPYCHRILKPNLDHIYNKILNSCWEPDEEESDNIMFMEANLYVDEIYNEICEKYDRLDIITNKTLNEVSRRRFLEIMLSYISDMFMDVYSKVKKVYTYISYVLMFIFASVHQLVEEQC